MVAVAQLVRVPDCDSGGRGFGRRMAFYIGKNAPRFEGGRLILRGIDLAGEVFRAVSSVGRAVDS